MTKLEIPFNKYKVDSFKLSIDVDKFEKVCIPDKFILIAADTGEEISTFKKSSIAVDYLNTKVYIGLYRRLLRGIQYDKVIILFSSKVAGDRYFEGISKKEVLEVLEHIRSLGYFTYTNVDDIYKNLFVSDFDIKVDFLFEKTDRENIVKYNRELYERFQFEKNECHPYNRQDNLGIQCFNRERSTVSKPFIKFYDKFKEITKKHPDFYGTLPEALKSILRDNFVYRYEFTIKDKKMCANFGINNRLEEILEVSQEKWTEIGKSILNRLFQYKVKRVKDNTKLNYYEKVLALLMSDDIHHNKLSIHQVKKKYTSVQATRQQKQRAGELFDKVYQSITVGENRNIHSEYKSIQRFDVIFGFV